MSRLTAKRSAMWAAPLLVASLALLIGLSGGANPAPTRVAASPSAAGSLGYFDSVRHTSFAVELDTGSPLEGWFLFAIPGIGLYWPDGSATVTVEIDGSITLSYTGDAFFDDSADVDGTFGWLHTPSGSAAVVSISLSGTISEDQGTLDVSLEHGMETYTVESEPAPETASAALDDTIEFLELEDYESLYAQLIPFFQDEVTEHEFVTETTAYFGEYGTVSSVTLVDSIVYELNPSYGPQYARARLSVEFSTGGGPETYTMPIVYLWYDGEWRVAEMGEFEEKGWLLAFLGYPGLEVVDAEFTVPPSALIVHADGFFADDYDTTEITLSLASSPDGATLTCASALTQQVTGGMAEWEECSVDKVGTYVLRISADGFDPVDGEEIKVVAVTGQLAADGEPVTLAQVIPGSGALFFIEPDGESDYSIVVESTEPAVHLLIRGPSWHVRARGQGTDGLTYLEFRGPWDLLLPENNRVSARAPGMFFVEHTARMYVIPPDASDTIALDGQPHDLSVGVPGQNVRFDFTIGSDSSLRAAVLLDGQRAAGASVNLFTDMGVFIAGMSFDEGDGVLYSPPLSAGTYYVSVDPAGPFTGDVYLSATAIADQVVAGSIGTPEEVEVTVQGQNYRLQFSGTASTTVGIDISGSDFENLDIRVVDPSGAFIGWFWLSSPGDYFPGVELPGTGQYEVWLLPGGGTGSATIEVLLE